MFLIFVFLCKYDKKNFTSSQGQIDGNVVKLKFTLPPRQRASSPLKPPPPPPKRDAPQNDKVAIGAEKDAQQRPGGCKCLKLYIAYRLFRAYYNGHFSVIWLFNKHCPHLG